MIFDFRLRVFYVVARRLSFTRAAEELFITQPAISKHIHLLEQEYQLKLFERKGNSIQLTEGGKILMKYAKELDAVYSRMEEEMGQPDAAGRGTFHIGASTTVAQYVLPALLADFQKKFENIHLKINSGNTENIQQALIAGDLDVGFIEGHTKNKQIKYLPFRDDELICVVRSNHKLATKKVITSADLPGIPFVMREPGSGTLEVIHQALRKLGIKPAQLYVAMQLDSTEAIKTYLLHSSCAAFISRYGIARDLEQNIFTELNIQGLRIERKLGLIHLQGKPSRVAALFIKFALHYNLK